MISPLNPMNGSSAQFLYLRPDVPIDDLIVFQKPDVSVHTLRGFTASEVMHDLQSFPEPSPGAAARAGRALFEWTKSLAGTVIFVLVFTSYVAQATKVPTASMQPTILVGDHFFLDKIFFPGNFPKALVPYLPKREIRHGDI